MSAFTKEELKEAIKGKIIPLGHPNHPGASPSSPHHGEWRKTKAEKDADKNYAAMQKRHAAGKDPFKQHGPKEIDISHPAVHKALEKHLGGSFEHFDSNPVHHHVNDTDGKKHAAVNVRVTHSYTHADMGMRPDEMENTSETYPVKITRKGGQYHVNHISGLREEVELEEADRGYDSGSTRHSVEEIKKDFPKQFKSKNITVHPHVNDSLHHLVIDHDTHHFGTVQHPRKGVDAAKGPVWSDAPDVESPSAYMGKKEREDRYKKLCHTYAPHKLKEDTDFSTTLNNLIIERFNQK